MAKGLRFIKQLKSLLTQRVRVYKQYHISSNIAELVTRFRSLYVLFKLIENGDFIHSV